MRLFLAGLIVGAALIIQGEGRADGPGLRLHRELPLSGYGEWSRVMAVCDEANGTLIYIAKYGLSDSGVAMQILPNGCRR